MVNITRIFHPIGQGGFFSEHHELSSEKEFIIVYDCGVAHNRSSADSVVQSHLLKGVEIDILFISHFDYDHVCKLKVLSSHVKSIKNVVMPLLSKAERIRLTNLFRASGFNVLKMINSPQSFFGSTTRIFSVAPREIVDGDGPQDEVAVSLDSISPAESLRSGVKIRVSAGAAPSNYDWVFIPHNHESTKNLKLLEAELTREGISTHLLRTDPKYTLDKSIVKRKLIKDVYNRLPGGINVNSMVVYSGPGNSTSRLRLRQNLQGDVSIHKLSNLNAHFETFSRTFPIWWGLADEDNLREIYWLYDYDFWITYSSPGCVYTGDVDFNEVDVARVFGDVWNQVGTLQIPHHGAAPCFNESILKESTLICPIAVGTNFLRKYGHPAISVINTIISNRCVPVLVTENNSGFVQRVS